MQYRHVPDGQTDGQLDGCIVRNAHNTVFSWKRSAVCAHVVYFLHSTMPSVTCLRLSDVSVICRVIFSFQFSLLFFHVGQPGSTEAYWFCPIADIGRRQTTTDNRHQPAKQYWPIRRASKSTSARDWKLTLYTLHITQINEYAVLEIAVLFDQLMASAPYSK